MIQTPNNILRFKLHSLILIAIFSYFAIGQENEINIPFRLTSANNISVQAVLNDKDTVNLMFHTAANSVTLTEDAVKKLKSLTFTKSSEGVKSWGGSENSARVSENNSLKIGKMKWNGISISENKQSGPETDGKFGLDLFKGKVIELDFDKKVMIISSTLPKNIKHFQKLKLIFEDDLMFLEANCRIGNRLLKNIFLLHSGYSGGILFDDEFTQRNEIDKHLKITGSQELKDSFGNILKTNKAILPELIIGNEKLKDVPAGFFTGAIGNQKMSIIGGDVLKRFNIIFDAKREYVYLKPNNLKKAKYT
ncbi:MAG: aspartyl protease family protein [Pyrinomonadaceae bacterium]|nr:aspartyl protease family protein [Pyrinomonadaceae bacterium]